jgi:VWFA-related protein
LLVLLSLCSVGSAQSSAGQNAPANAAQTTGQSASQPPSNAGQSASPPSTQPASAPASSTPGPSSSSPSDQAAPSKPAADPAAGDQENGVFVFKKEVEEVLIHATVIDDKTHRLVTNLDKTAFTVFENEQRQNITFFRNEDIPVAMGIIIDNSGSMREKRDKVNKAALNLVRSSNPQDEVFVVNFNDEYYLDQGFTSNVAKLREALEKVEARGGTALYDALLASADYEKNNSRLQRKVLFVVTDGEDNASRTTLEQAVRRLQEENGPTVYAIGLLGEERAHRARRALETVAQRTGGMVFLPKTLDEVDEISKTVAHDIRNQYTLGYKPSSPKSAGGYRSLRVEAKSKSGKLVVRTRSGYYPGQEPSP